MHIRSALPFALVTPLALIACERKPVEPPPAQKSAPEIAAAPPAPPPPWFICDAVDAPTVLVVSRPDARREVTILRIDKADLHPPVAALYVLGAEDPGAGSVTQTLSRDGAEAGFIRSANPGMLDKPQEATTAPVLSVKLDESSLSCRWLARTRLFGLTTGRTVLVTDADDGPMLRTFDFKDPRGRTQTNPDGAQRSNPPTLRIAGGKADGDRFTFANAGYGYVVDGHRFAVTQGGQPTSDEPFVAVQRAGAH